MKQSTLDLLAYYGQGEEQAALPDGYASLEYLESTGVQIIDTGIQANYSTVVSATFQLTTVTTQFGIFGDSTANARCYFAKNTSNAGWQVGMGSMVTYFGQPDTNRHTVEIDIPGSRYIFDEASAKVSLSFSGSSRSLMLFGWAGMARVMKGRVYTFTIRNNGAVVCNLIPVMRISDGKPGMYDIARGLFLVNQGTGEDFKTPLDALGYRRVKCIKGNTNQKVDTGILGNNDNLDCETEFRVSSYLQYGAIYGAYLGEQANATRAIQGATSAGATLLYTNGKAAGGGTTVTDTPPGQWHYVRASRTRILMDDRTMAVTNTIQGTALGNISIKLFNAGVASTNVTISFKYFCIYDNGVRLRCMLPVVRTSDSKPGMYDMVTNTFMVNSGSGELEYEELDQ